MVVAIRFGGFFINWLLGAFALGAISAASTISTPAMTKFGNILRGSIGTWAALRKSVKTSNGYEGFLFLLVTESVVGSYLGGHAVHYGLALVTPTFLQNADWYSWAVAFIAVLAAAAVEPPLFIGLSLLADKELSTSRSFPLTSRQA